jgi:ABC-2 type transport system permease protein
MRSFHKLTLVQAKLYLREPLAMFFTLLFAPLMLVLLGFVFGNDPDPMFGGRGYLDISVPAYSAIVVGITGLTMIPITTAIRKETGVLRRFSATPLRPITYFLSDVVVPYLMLSLGILLLFLFGKVLYNVRFEGNLLSVFTGVSLSILTFFSIGYALAGLIPNSRAVIAIGNILIIPMAFLSGAYFPIENMPESVVKVSKFFPLTHTVTLLRGLWFGGTWGDYLTEVAVMAGFLCLGLVIISRTFCWE